MAQTKSTKNTAAKTGTGAERASELKDALVDKALKKRWDDAISRYRKALVEETSGWDDRYEALDEIINSEPPYYLAASYKTVREFLKAEAPGETERGVRMGMRVAAHFDPQDESRYGISNLDALLSYLEAEAGGQLGRAKVHPERQKVRVKQGKTIRLVPFAEATRDQIKAAARVAQGKAGGTSASMPPVVKALKKALATAGLADIAVSMRGGKVALSGIPTESFAALAKALKGVKGA